MGIFQLLSGEGEKKEEINIIIIKHTHLEQVLFMCDKTEEQTTCIMHDHAGDKRRFQQLQCVDHLEPGKGSNSLKEPPQQTSKIYLYPHLKLD